LLDILEADALLEEVPRGVHLRDYVVDSGAISEGQLHDVLAVNVREVCLGAFQLESGPYRFDHGSDWIQRLEIFPQNPIELIATGLRRHFERPALASRMAAWRGGYVVRTEKFDLFRVHLTTSEQEEEWLESIDGEGTLTELAARNTDDAEGFAAFVAILKAADMVDFHDRPRRTAERSPDRVPIDQLEMPEPLEPLAPETSEDSAEEPAAEEPEREPRSPRARRDAKLVATEQTVKRLHYLLRKGAEYAELLGVTPGSTVRTVRVAYANIIKQLPNDFVLRLTPELQAQAAQIREALQDACNALIEPRGASRPNKPKTPRKVRAPKAGKVRSAESRRSPIKGRRRRRRTPFGMARRHAEAENWPEAMTAIKTGLAMAPRNPRLIALEAWIAFNLPTAPAEHDRQTARSRLRIALSIANGLADPYFYMGRIEEAQGNPLDAAMYYKSALAVEPEHKESKARLAELVGG